MFARQGFGNPFSHFTVGTNPFIFGSGFGGITPTTPNISSFGTVPFTGGPISGFTPATPFVTPMFGAGLIPTINPILGTPYAATNPLGVPFLNPQAGSVFGAFGGVAPVAPAMGGVNFNPLTGIPLTGFGTFNPYLMSQLGAGLTPTINPTLIPFLTPQFGVNLGLSGIAPSTGLLGTPLTSHFGGIGQYGALYGAPSGIGSLGYGNVPYGAGITGLVNPGVGTVNPQVINPFLTGTATAFDPQSAALLTHQLNAVAQQPPIRSLIGSQQFEQFQPNIPGATGTAIGQWADPYSTWAVMNAQLAANPLQQMYRGLAGTHGVLGVGLPTTISQPLAATACAPFCI